MPKNGPKDDAATGREFAMTAFRLSQERNDFPPSDPDFVNKSKWVNLRPEYGGLCGREEEKPLHRVSPQYPNTPTFLYESELGRYEVMDGQQRLNAVVEFYEGG